MIKISNFTFNPFGEITTVLWDDTMEGVIFDPGFYSEKEEKDFFDFIDEKKIIVKAVLLTHGHFDHIYGAASCQKRLGVKVYMHPADKIYLEGLDGQMVDKFNLREPDCSFTTTDIKEGDSLTFGNTSFEVIETPGHTPGGVCFFDKEDKVLICGDTLFAGSIGRSDLPGGDYDKLITSLMDKVMGLDGDVVAIPGHGPRTDIGYERTHNPFLQPFNEPEEDMEAEKMFNEGEDNA